MSKCLLKRIVPFAAALVLGLFVASFFVTVAAPQFNFKRNNYPRKNREVRQLKDENLRLNDELRQAKRKIAELEMRRTMSFENDFETEVPLAPPPSVPRRVR